MQPPNYTPNYTTLLGGFIGGNAYHYVEENVPRIIACNALRIPLLLPPVCNTMYYIHATHNVTYYTIYVANITLSGTGSKRCPFGVCRPPKIGGLGRSLTPVLPTVYVIPWLFGPFLHTLKTSKYPILEGSRGLIPQCRRVKSPNERVPKGVF